MKFELHINVGTVGMEDQHDVAWALHAIADRLNKSISTGWSPYQLSGTIKSRDGRDVGTWEVKP